MRTTAGNPGGAAPAGSPRPPRRAIGETAPSFPVFQLRPPLTRGAPAPLATRTRTQADAAPGVTGHLRMRGGRTGGSLGAGPAFTVSDRPGPAGSRVAAGNGFCPWPPCARLPWLARRGLPLFAGQPAAADGSAPDPHRDPGRRPAAPMPALGARCVACAGGAHLPAPEVRVVKGAGAPLVSGGRSGKTGKDGAVRVWLAGVAGACPRVRHHPGFPGCGPHPAWAPPARAPWNYSSRANGRSGPFTVLPGVAVYGRASLGMARGVWVRRGRLWPGGVPLGHRAGGSVGISLSRGIGLAVKIVDGCIRHSDSIHPLSLSSGRPIGITAKTPVNPKPPTSNNSKKRAALAVSRAR